MVILIDFALATSYEDDPVEFWSRNVISAKRLKGTTLKYAPPEIVEFSKIYGREGSLESAVIKKEGRTIVLREGEGSGAGSLKFNPFSIDN